MRALRNFTCVLFFFLIPGLLFASAPDLKKAYSTKVELKGTLGSMMKLFGGNKPTYQVEYLKGDLKRIDTVDKKGKIISSQIIDLDRELFITVDYSNKK